MGYFGPIGAGSIFYSALVLDEFDTAQAPPGSDAAKIRILVKPVIYALVLSSLVGHTLAIPVLEKILDRKGVGNIKLASAESDLGEDADPSASDREGYASRRAWQQVGLPAADDEEDGGGEAEYEAGESSAPETSASEPYKLHKEQNPSRLQSHQSRRWHSSVDRGRDGELQERPHNGRLASTSPSMRSSLGSGAYDYDGRWNPSPSWRYSSSHLPKTGHKLGPHVAHEHLEQEQEREEEGDEEEGERILTRRFDEESGPSRT